jgi:CheY-like chemotaxis protein
LGLTASHSIIQKHNGSICVASQLNQGTTFTIVLPAVTDGAATLVPAELVQPVALSLPPAHLLVLDDEEILRDLLRDMLAMLGITAAFAADGKDAIQQYTVAQTAGRAFDAVIMDLTIPGGMGGKETAQALLQLEPQIKMIVSSGYATDPVLAEYRDYGFMARLAKPYRFAELKAVLARVLQ